MGYTKALYEADDNNKHLGRVSDDIVAIANNPVATGTATSSIKYKVSKSNREHGIRPRLAICTREVEVPGEDRSLIYTLRVPIFTKTAWASASWQLNAEVTYGGEEWAVTSREPEDY